MADETQYKFDVSDALKSLSDLQSAFLAHNSSLGSVVQVLQRVNTVGGATSTTFTQMNDAAKATVTTIQGNANSFKILSFAAKDANTQLRNLYNTQNALVRFNIRQPGGGNQAVGGVVPAIGGIPNLGPQSPLAGGAGGAGGGGPPVAAPAAPIPGGNPQNAAAAQIRALRSVLGPIRENEAALNRLSDAFHNALNIGGRILVYQVLHRAFATIIQDMQQAITDAAEFNRQLGLIRTISQDSGNSLEDFRSEITSIANEFGRPVVDVAKAAYQGLSNQVLQTTKDFGLLRQAVAFSKITDSDATSSIDLFSSAINAFNLTANDGRRIAAGFFKTIDLGRVTTKDLAGTFGVIAPLASQVGLSFEETNAAIAKISQSGTKTDVALTLAANAIKAFIKPSNELQKVISELGFSTGEELIAAKGFSGALDLVIKSADGSSTELAKLFADFRELRGIIGLNSQGVKSFNENLKEIKEGSEAYDNALIEMRKNSGQRFQDELTKVKNYFTDEFGTRILSIATEISDKFGGIANVVRTMTEAVTYLGIAMGSVFAVTRLISFARYLDNAVLIFTTLVKTTNIAKAAMVAFGITTQIQMAAVTLGLSALVAGLVYLTYKASTAEAALHEAFKGNYENEKRAFAEITEAIHEETDKQISIIEGGQRLARAAFLQTAAIVQRSLSAVRSSQTETYKNVLNSLKEDVDSLLSTMRANVSDLTSQQKKAENEIAKASEDSIEAQDRASKDLFDTELSRLLAYQHQNQRASAQIEKANDARQRALTGALKAQTNLNKAAGSESGNVDQLRNTAERAQAALKKLNDTSGQKVPRSYGNVQGLIKELTEGRLGILKGRALELIDNGNIDEARKQLTEAESILRSLGSQTANINGHVVPLFNTESEVNVVLKLRQSLNDKIIAQKLQEVEATRKLKQEEEARLRKATDIFEQIAKFKAVDKEGKLLPEFKTPQDAVNSLRKLQQQVFDLVGAAQVLNNPSLLRDFAEELSRVESGLNAQGRAVVQQVNTSLAQDQLDKLKTKYKSFSDQAAKSTKELGDSLKTLQSEIGRNSAFATSTAQGLNQAAPNGFKVKSFVPELQEALEQGKELGPLIDKLGQWRQMITEDLHGAPKYPGPIPGTNLQQSMDFLETRLRMIQNERKEAEELKSQLETVSNEFQSKSIDLQAGVQTLLPDLKSLAPALAPIGPTADESVRQAVGAMEALDAAALATKKQIDILGESIRSLPPVPVGPGGAGPAAESPKPHAMGGFVNPGVGGAISDFLSGAYRRGADTQPVIAQPGEFFVRAAAVSKFAPELIAMNAGRDPWQSSGGGNQVQVGDIHVHVQGGSTNTQTVNEIGRGLQRNIRLGLLRLS